MTSTVTPHHENNKAAFVHRHVPSVPLCCISITEATSSLWHLRLFLSPHALYLLSHPSIIHSFIPNASPTSLHQPSIRCFRLRHPWIPLSCPSSLHISPLSCAPVLLLQSSLTASLSPPIPFFDGPGKTCWLSESGIHTINPALLSGQQWAQPHQFHPL